MKTKIMIAFLVITLAACAPMHTGTPDIQTTAIAQTGVALTQTVLPTATLPPPTFTQTALTTPTPPATPLPTQPIIAMTPDSIQVKRWKEYEDALGKKILSSETSILCEWEILGRAEHEVYVWAVCDGVSVPAVIYLEADEGIKKVDVPGMSSDWGSDVRRMFPEYVREKFQYRNESVSKMLAHLEWRRMHQEEPPLIVLSATLTQ